MRKIIDLIKIKLNFKSFYVVIFAFSILVNLIVHLYLISSYGQIKPSPDAKLYLEIAYAIRHFSSSLFGIYNPDFAGEDIGYVIMPGYPLLISPLFENFQLIAIFQVILFSIGLYFLYKILQNKFLIIFVFITCIWIIISTSWPYHNVPLIESPTISILLILIYFLDKYFKDYQLKDFIWFSIIFGILIAINNRYIFHYCGLIPFLLFLKIFEKRIKFKHLLLSILIVTAIMAPWHIRQYIHYGEFVLFSPLRNETYKKAKERDEKMDTLIMVSKFKDYLMDSLNHPLKDDPKELEKCRLAWLERQKLYQRQAIDIAEKNKQNVSIEVTKKPSIIEPLKSKIGSKTKLNIPPKKEQKTIASNTEKQKYKAKQKVEQKTIASNTEKQKNEAKQKAESKATQEKKPKVEQKTIASDTEKPKQDVKQKEGSVKSKSKPETFKEKAKPEAKPKVEQKTIASNTEKQKNEAKQKAESKATQEKKPKVEQKTIASDTEKPKQDVKQKEGSVKSKSKPETFKEKAKPEAKPKEEQKTIASNTEKQKNEAKQKAESKATQEKKPKVEQKTIASNTEKQKNEAKQKTISIQPQVKPKVVQPQQRNEIQVNVNTQINPSAKIIKIDTQLVIRKTIEQPSKISSNSQEPVIKTDSFIVVKKEFEVPEEIKIISKFHNISYDTIVQIPPSKYISLHSNKVQPVFNYNDGKIDIVIENFQVISLKVLDFSDNKEIRKFENMRIRKMVPAYDAIINALLKSHSNFGDTPEKLQKFLSDFSYEKYKQLVYEKFEPSNKFELFWNRFVDHFVFYRTDFELTPQWDPRIRWPSHYNNPVEMILDGIMLPLVFINIIPLIIALYKRDWFVVSLFVMVLLHIILHSLVSSVGDRGRYRLTIYPVWITFAVYGYDQIARWIIKKLKEKNITRAYFASIFSLIKK